MVLAGGGLNGVKTLFGGSYNPSAYHVMQCIHTKAHITVNDKNKNKEIQQWFFYFCSLLFNKYHFQVPLAKNYGLSLVESSKNLHTN